MVTSNLMDIVVLGSANADLVVGVDRRPSPGETVLGSDTTVLPGPLPPSANGEYAITPTSLYRTRSSPLAITSSPA